MDTEKKLEQLVEKQRTYFAEGKTLPIEARLRALGLLEQAIRGREEELCRALKA